MPAGRSYRAGDSIEDDCRACKTDRLHTVVAADSDGRPIRVVGEPLKNCPQCGACIPSAQNPCPECNYEWVPEKRKLPKIYNVALQWVTDATELEGVPEALRRDEWHLRLSWPIFDLRKFFV